MPSEMCLPIGSKRLLDRAAASALRVHERCGFVLSMPAAEYAPDMGDRLAADIHRHRGLIRDVLADTDIHESLYAEDRLAIPATAESLCFFAKQMDRARNELAPQARVSPLYDVWTRARLNARLLQSVRWSTRDQPHPAAHNQPPPHKPKLSLHIRWMLQRDWPEVLDIDGKNFEFPLVADDLARQLNARNSTGMVAELQERTVGYIIYELAHRLRNVVRLAVKPEMRGRGIGSLLLEKMLTIRTPLRPRTLLEVPETNRSAMAFAQAQGYAEVARIPCAYPGVDDDAFILEHHQTSSRGDRGDKRNEIAA